MSDDAKRFHVDIVSNQPLTGGQYLLARVRVHDGRLQIEAKFPDQLRETLMRVVPEIDPNRDPEGFLAALPERVDYTYVIASAPHADGECRFGPIAR